MSQIIEIGILLGLLFLSVSPVKELNLRKLIGVEDRMI